MVHSKEILTELQEIAPFLGKSDFSGVSFTVPTGYFEEFIEILMHRIQTGDAEISPLEEINSISPLLAGLQKKNPFQVPEGYFEAVNMKIPSSENSNTKLVAIYPESLQTNAGYYPQGPIKSEAKPVSISYRVMKYAIAACLIGLLGITLYNNLSNRSVPDPLHSLTTVSDQDMANYLDSDDIHWTPGLAPETASAEFTDADIRALFSNVSDQELEQYHPEFPLKKATAN